MMYIVLPDLDLSDDISRFNITITINANSDGKEIEFIHELEARLEGSEVIPDGE